MQCSSTVTADVGEERERMKEKGIEKEREKNRESEKTAREYNKKMQPNSSSKQRLSKVCRSRQRGRQREAYSYICTILSLSIMSQRSVLTLDPKPSSFFRLRSARESDPFPVTSQDMVIYLSVAVQTGNAYSDRNQYKLKLQGLDFLLKTVQIYKSEEDKSKSLILLLCSYCVGVLPKLEQQYTLLIPVGN